MGIPIMLEVKDWPVLIVGGGPIGYRKAKALMDQGARVTCVSETFEEAFYDLGPKIRLYRRHFLDKDLEGMRLVVVATNDFNLQDSLYQRCKKCGILCLTTDHFAPSDLSYMAKTEREGLTIGVSTGGQAPGFAKDFVNYLAKYLEGPWFNQYKDQVEARKDMLHKKYEMED